MKDPVAASEGRFSEYLGGMYIPGYVAKPNYLEAPSEGEAIAQANLAYRWVA
jgi:hypothetical protein